LGECIALRPSEMIAGVMWLWPKPLIPKNIKNEVTSTIFLPKSPQVANDRSTVKYDNNLKLLSFQSTVFGVHSTISEQPTPQQFVDIPETYAKVLDSWNQYSSFDSAQGTVYLTKPKNNGNKQAAVMNSKGTLMFITPDKDLSGDQWRQFFNSLQIQN
jgi:hypothetical protein